MADQFLSLLHHLALGDPQGGLGHGHSKVVDLNAVELADGHLDGVGDLAQGDLAVLQGINDLVLQPTERQIGFREEVARAAGRVYVPTDFDTIEKAFSGVKTAEKGIKQGLSRSIYDFGSPFSLYSI